MYNRAPLSFYLLTHLLISHRSGGEGSLTFYWRLTRRRCSNGGVCNIRLDFTGLILLISHVKWCDTTPAAEIGPSTNKCTSTPRSSISHFARPRYSYSLERGVMSKMRRLATKIPLVPWTKIGYVDLAKHQSGRGKRDYCCFDLF